MMHHDSALPKAQLVINEAIETEVAFKESTLQLCQILFAIEQRAPLTLHRYISARDLPKYMNACARIKQGSDLVCLFFDALKICLTIPCLYSSQVHFPRSSDQVLSRIIALHLDQNPTKVQLTTLKNQLLLVQSQNTNDEDNYAYATELLIRLFNIASHLFHEHLNDMRDLSFLHTRITSLDYRTGDPISKVVTQHIDELSLSHLLQDDRGQHSFQAFTIKGIQRMMKYPLLINELCKSLEVCELSSQLLRFNEGLKKILSFINSQQQDAENMMTIRNNEIRANLVMIDSLNQQFSGGTAIIEAPHKANLDELAQLFSLCLNRQYTSAPIFSPSINASIDKMVRHTRKPMIIDIEGHDYKGTLNPLSTALKYQHVLNQGYVPRVETRSVQQLYGYTKPFEITSLNPLVLWAQLTQAGQDGVMVTLSKEARTCLHKYLKSKATPPLILSVLNEPNDSLAERFQLFTRLFQHAKYPNKVRIKNLNQRPLIRSYTPKPPPPTPSTILKQLASLTEITNNLDELQQTAGSLEVASDTEVPDRQGRRFPPPPPPFRSSMQDKSPPPPPPFRGASLSNVVDESECKQAEVTDITEQSNLVYVHRKPTSRTKPRPPSNPPPPAPPPPSSWTEQGATQAMRRRDSI